MSMDMKPVLNINNLWLHTSFSILTKGSQHRVLDYHLGGNIWESIWNRIDIFQVEKVDKSTSGEWILLRKDADE